MPLFLSILLTSGLAWGQAPPDRQIPPSVQTEVKLLEHRFEVALATDCDPQRCYSKGCVYAGHDVSDQPRSRSLPGLAQEAGPGSAPSQDYLTAASCAYAYEDSVEARDVNALTRRLQAKLTGGWLTVTVDAEKLQPIPPYLRERPVEPEPEPEEEEPEPEPEPEEAAEPEEWTLGMAMRELWNSLLPHFYWMIGMLLFAVTGTILIWAWRRVGAASIEEQMLLAEIGRGEPVPEGSDDADGAPAEETPEDEVRREAAAWRVRLDGMDRSDPDPEIRALTEALLRDGELALLAKAMLTFPDALPSAFPEGADVAASKLELSQYLKGIDPSELPDDKAFYRALNRHALAATLGAQPDAELVRSLRDDFGAAGLAELMGRLSSRPAALLFALAPLDEQLEVVRLLSPNRSQQIASALLASNRMDPAEARYLFDVVSSSRDGQGMPDTPAPAEVTDRGSAFDAEGALSVLLETVNPSRRGALFQAAADRFNGALPSWYRGILVGDMLLKLPSDTRADLLLQVEGEPLAGWLSLLDPETAQRILEGAPNALRASVQSFGRFASRARQLTMARRGRSNMAKVFTSGLARAGIPFEQIVLPVGTAEP